MENIARAMKGRPITRSMRTLVKAPRFFVKEKGPLENRITPDKKCPYRSGRRRLLTMKTSFPAGKLLPLAVLLIAPSFAHAHTGVGQTNGFLHGAGHPLGGLDHLCAMIAVGL